MKVSDFDYALPEELIANHPPKVRGTSRLLVLDRKTGNIEDKKYSDIVDYLNPGDVLVLNDTKVMKARLIATKNNGSKRGLVILEKHADNDWFEHQVLYRGKLTKGDELFIDDNKLVVDEILGNGIAVISSKIDLVKLSDKYGAPPLPPYMKRNATKDDVKRYQTVFAREVGSAAAPTASLNLTKNILDKIHKKGVKICYITLHVGLGTFLPIRTENVEDHQIHSEYFTMPSKTLIAMNEAKNSGNRVIAVGTTVARTLEHFTCHHQRSDTYSSKYVGSLETLSGEANIYIYPGYKFKCVDALVTNFHAPGSTVLLLTAAFANWSNLSQAYQHAIEHSYRLLSYGDSMLIL